MTMSAYDATEVCVLMGPYMLNLLSKKYNKSNFGLYHDDTLAILKNKVGHNQTGTEKHSGNI